MASVLLDFLREHGPTPARQILSALAVSQPTLSRLIAADGGREIARIGRARATLYAATREVTGEGRSWPVYRIDSHGKPAIAAHLHALAPKSWWYQAEPPSPSWLHGDHASGIFPGLPWFLDDLRPQGFLGRAFAHRHAGDLGLSPDPRRWGPEEVLRVLIRFGTDLPGDFVIGDPALERFQRASLEAPATVAGSDRAARYDALAAAAMAGDLPGSSAGGEQPKFTVSVEGSQGPRHLLVKFSPPRGATTAARWIDLLLSEHIAAEVLRESGLAVSATSWFESDDRGYLEVSRFDRVGSRGRRGFVSIFALDSAYYGHLDDWWSAADRLLRDGWLDASSADSLRVLWWTGRFIGNTDMHFANVSLEFTERRPLALAPAYDMVPMHYRPAASGEVTLTPLRLPIPPPGHREVARRAATIALAFWKRAAADIRISAPLRAEAARVGEDLTRLTDAVLS